MKTITGIYTGLLVLGLLCIIGIAAAQEDTNETLLTDDIQAYNGPIGADSPLYGLKIALEDIDESFTANETDRVEKQMNHARLRLSEVRRSLDLNESDSVQQALNNYGLKMNLTNATISSWGSNPAGLLHAQEMIVKHQFVLENLLADNPDNTGLQRAYNNSLRLEEKFQEKTMIRFQRTMEKHNKTLLKAIRLERREQNRTGWPDGETTVTSAQTDDKQKGWEKNSDKGAGTGKPVTTVTTQAPSGNQQQQEPGEQQNSNSGGNGKGNSRNK